MSFVERLALTLNPPPPITATAFYRASGFEPDPWQSAVLEDEASRIGLMATRQGGKSTVVGTKVMHHALTRPRAMVVIGSPSQRQSMELLAKGVDSFYLNTGTLDGVEVSHTVGDRSKRITGDVRDWFGEMTDREKPIDVEMDSQSKTEVRLSNRSRIVAVPGRSGATVRSFSSVTLLVIDEAAFAQVEFYQAVFPMLAVSHGQIILLSTPYAKLGVFYDVMMATEDWTDGVPADEQESAWRKYVIPWQMCPRITPAFVEAERNRYGDNYVAREYECVFQDAVGAVFREEDIMAMGRDDVEVWDLP